MNCKLCDAPLSVQEQLTYGSRCEDCWCRPGGKTIRNSSPFDGAAECYPSGRQTIVDPAEITNQTTPHAGTYRARGRRVKK